jgi:hypothetical protein
MELELFAPIARSNIFVQSAGAPSDNPAMSLDRQAKIIALDQFAATAMDRRR